MADELKLTCTNGDLWTATQPYADNQRAFANVIAVPMKALMVMNRTALVKAVEAALQEIDAARIACCEHHGIKSEDGTHYVFATPDAEAACNAEFADVLAQPRTLVGVKPLRLQDLRPDAFLSHDDVTRCGPLLTD